MDETSDPAVEITATRLIPVGSMNINESPGSLLSALLTGSSSVGAVQSLRI